MRGGLCVISVVPAASEATLGARTRHDGPRGWCAERRERASHARGDARGSAKSPVRPENAAMALTAIPSPPQTAPKRKPRHTPVRAAPRHAIKPSIFLLWRACRC
eukprot:7313947-Prymnesium_polylepis.1